MTSPLIWLHEEAIRTTHPVFKSAPEGTRAIFVWDDDYLRKIDYSLKRLVFIYETLCELPLDIIQGNIAHTINEMSPSCLYVPASNKPHIISVIDHLQSITNIRVIQDEDFVTIPPSKNLNRFFKYWNVAKQTALQRNGRLDT